MVLIIMLCAWLALLNATPVRAATTVEIGAIFKDSINENNKSKDYKVVVQKGKQVMIGAINLSFDALSANPANDMKVTEVNCPGGAVNPPAGESKSNGGVVYCTPKGRDNYFEVDFKVKNEKGGRVEYAVFVQRTDETDDGSPLNLPDDLQGRLGHVSPQKVKLYSVTPTVNFDQAKFLLQYAPSSENNELKLVARFYSSKDASARCSAALLRQSSTDAVATGLPAFTPCDPFSTDGDRYPLFLVVVNYVGGEGCYRLYLADNDTTLGTNQPVGNVGKCEE
jgi:hypothetical protein